MYKEISGLLNVALSVGGSVRFLFLDQKWLIVFKFKFKNGPNKNSQKIIFDNFGFFPTVYNLWGRCTWRNYQDRLYFSHLRLRTRLRGGRGGGLEDLDLDDLVHVWQRLHHLPAHDSRVERRIPTRGRGGVGWWGREHPRRPGPVPAWRTQGRADPLPRHAHLDILRHYKDICISISDPR